MVKAELKQQHPFELVHFRVGFERVRISHTWCWWYFCLPFSQFISNSTLTLGALFSLCFFYTFCFVQCDLSLFLFFPNAWRFNDKSFFSRTHLRTGFKMFIQRLHKCMHTIKCVMWKNIATVKPPNNDIPEIFWRILLFKRRNSRTSKKYSMWFALVGLGCWVNFLHVFLLYMFSLVFCSLIVYFYWCGKWKFHCIIMDTADQTANRDKNDCFFNRQ